MDCCISRGTTAAQQAGEQVQEAQPTKKNGRATRLHVKESHTHKTVPTLYSAVSLVPRTTAAIKCRASSRVRMTQLSRPRRIFSRNVDQLPRPQVHRPQHIATKANAGGKNKTTVEQNKLNKLTTAVHAHSSSKHSQKRSHKHTTRKHIPGRPKANLPHYFTHAHLSLLYLRELPASPQQPQPPHCPPLLTQNPLQHFYPHCCAGASVVAAAAAAVVMLF